MYGGIDDIVAELRALRVASLEYRQRRDVPPKLPSRKALATIVEGLSAALFPNRLGLPHLTDEGIDYYVGHLLDVTLRELLPQVSRELRFTLGREDLDRGGSGTGGWHCTGFCKTATAHSRLAG